jgi:hypothetical protein
MKDRQRPRRGDGITVVSFGMSKVLTTYGDGRVEPADDVAAFSYIDAYGWANAQCPPKHAGTGEGPDTVHWGIDEWGCRYVRNGGGGGVSERGTKMCTNLYSSFTHTHIQVCDS